MSTKAVSGNGGERVRPHYQWHKVLTIHLPGFTKDSLKVVKKGGNKLEICGEMGSKRFRQDFTVPGGCDIHKVTAKFQNGVLTITMPCHDDEAVNKPGGRSPPETTTSGEEQKKPTTHPS
ncbi:unnamed protein product, partial [Cuscuta epithymum]